ncbi:hypothetical protein AB0H83_47270 [Dactylosporangium sp. NPDC050688]|uniref:hypothetical protein n=1 Tax=Dactylosporangium sp. NPDC050688 TaxID=3157217 RepID=UPI00340F06EE
MRERLRLAVHRAHAPQLVLRFGYAPTAGFTSRRPVADVIDPAGDPGGEPVGELGADRGGGHGADRAGGTAG